MTTRSATLHAALLVLLATATARGDVCIDGARAEHRDCRATCREDYQTAKDACVNRDHACVEVCRAERAECREATGFDAAIDACNDGRDAAVANCRALYPIGPDRDLCIDEVQVDAFQCRDGVREAELPELLACRQEFRRCALGCPLVDPALLTEDRRRCRVGARRGYVRCLLACREDFQLAKDACLNRDHACVEECREERHECRAPILAALEAEIAACNATRDDAIATCRSLHPPDSPELDACIDQAQVVAFRCRDEARERARPGLASCREGFRACVTACPPAGSPSAAFLDR
jgi:hypothetical protein